MICISRCKRKGFVNQEPPTGNIVFVHVCLQVCYFLSLKCCLGLQFKNPNVAAEMAQLIMFDQETYVPCTTVNGKREILTQVPLHGDQLFDFHQREVEGHICASFMEMLNMKKMDGVFNYSNSVNKLIIL